MMQPLPEPRWVTIHSTEHVIPFLDRYVCVHANIINDAELASYGFARVMREHGDLWERERSVQLNGAYEDTGFGKPISPITVSSDKAEKDGKVERGDKAEEFGGAEGDARTPTVITYERIMSGRLVSIELIHFETTKMWLFTLQGAAFSQSLTYMVCAAAATTDAASEAGEGEVSPPRMKLWNRNG